MPHKLTHGAGPVSREKIHNDVRNVYKVRKLPVSHGHGFLYTQESDFQCSQTDPFGTAFSKQAHKTEGTPAVLGLHS